MLYSTSADITAHSLPFADWFAALHGHPDWPHALNASGFADVFDHWPSDGGLTPEQFAALFCVFYNETGGRLQPVAEMGGPAYCFGTNGGKKQSYNKPPNRLAGDQILAAGHSLTAAQHQAWNGQVWPGGEFADVARECDFYKYRGRGLIQTTWRTTYQRDVDPLFDDGRCCDDMSADELDRVFAEEPAVYLGAASAFFARMGAAWENVGPGRWAGVGARVSGSQAYGSGVYTRRCEAVWEALEA